MTTYLLIGDLHLTDRPKDEYRWGIFDYIRSLQEKYRPHRTIIMGDLTDDKDKHSAKLVNRIVEEMNLTYPIAIVMGNHDYVDDNMPFFNFLNSFEDVRFDVVRTWLDYPRLAVIPHVKSQEAFDRDVKHLGLREDSLLIAHNTFDGAISESGKVMTGLSPKNVPCAIYAGDIHRPQTSGQVTYVGSPYNIRFGDDFEPRVMLVTDNKAVPPQSIKTDFIRKHKIVVTDMLDPFQFGAKPGDQLKIEYQLTREEAADWQLIRSHTLFTCKQQGFDVHGITLKVVGQAPKKRTQIRASSYEDVVKHYLKGEKNINKDIRDMGLAIVRHV